jgi:hypothetical protein
MRIQSNNFVQFASRVYQQLPAFSGPQAPTAPAIPRGSAACIEHLRSLAQDERVKGIGAIIAIAETPMLVRLLGGFVELRKGVALEAPLEGLVITPSGLETLVGERPQGLQPLALFDTFDDLDGFKEALDAQLTALYEGCRKLKTRYFAPKNGLAAILMKSPDEM